MSYNSIWTYLWDVLDEGIDTVVEDVGEIAGCNDISLAVTYHSVKCYLPHNPKRKIYFGEDGVTYFRPNMGLYRDLLIKPRVSNLVEQQDEDVLEKLIERAQAAGLTVSAWFIALHNTPLGQAHPECVIRNVYGDPYFFAPCPSNPDVVEYYSTLVKDLGDQYDLNMVQVESPGFAKFTHECHHEKTGIPIRSTEEVLLSLCFCRSCRKRAEALGIDVANLQQKVRKRLSAANDGFGSTEAEGALNAGPTGFWADEEFREYVKMRTKSVNQFIGEMRKQLRSDLPLYVLHEGRPYGAWVSGQDLGKLAGVAEGVLTTCYGQDAEQASRIIRDARAVIGQGGPLMAGHHAIYPLCKGPEDLAKRVRVTTDQGADGHVFYNYGLMPRRNMAWIRNALCKQQG